MPEEHCKILRASSTNDWGLQFCRPTKNSDNKPAKTESPEEQQQADKLPDYPESITTGKLFGFVDAA